MGMNAAWHQLEIRSFEITADGQAAGKTVTSIEALHPTERMLGYTVPYAVSNTLLTLWGMVIVLVY
jgi:hypothetical protein